MHRRKSDPSVRIDACLVSRETSVHVESRRPSPSPAFGSVVPAHRLILAVPRVKDIAVAEPTHRTTGRCGDSPPSRPRNDLLGTPPLWRTWRPGHLRIS